MEQMQIKVNINFKILPFGCASIEVGAKTVEMGKEDLNKKEKREIPSILYTEPEITNIESFEVTF